MVLVAVMAAVATALVVAGCSRRVESTQIGVASASAAPGLAEPPSQAVGVVDSWLFVAAPGELSGVFRGWARPLPLLEQFVTRKQRNPFTGEEKSVRTREPEAPPRAAPDAVAQPDLARFELLGRKGLSPMDLLMLARAALDWDEDNARSEVYGRVFAGPPEAVGVLLEVPSALTARLAELTPAAAEGVAQRWGAFSREDAAGIQDVATRQHMLAMTDAEVSAPLGDLIRVARRAVATSRPMFLWIAV